MKEASLFGEQLLKGKEVGLGFDFESTDRYGRLSAYVYLLYGTFLNAEIIKQRYGFADAKHPFR